MIDYGRTIKTLCIKRKLPTENQIPGRSKMKSIFPNPISRIKMRIQQI